MRLSALLLASSLAACTASERVGYATPPQIVVREQVLVAVPLGFGPGLSRSGYAAIDQQFTDPGIRNGATPIHATLVNVDARTRDEAVAYLRTLGVPSGNIETSAGGTTSIKDKAGGREPSLVLSRYTAIPPECGQRVLVAGRPFDNTTDADFGCATLVDLALTVSDPKDLLGRPGVILADGERAARPVEAYRRFNAPPPEPAQPTTTQ